VNTSPTSTPNSGIDLSELDAHVRPQDDLFRHATGKWMARTQIPSDKARYGSFHVLAEEAEKAVRDIITGIGDAGEGSVERKVGDLFASFMAVDSVDSKGLAPIESQLAVAANVASVSQLLDTVARLERQGVGGFIDLFVDNDPGQPDRYLVFTEQGGINLPDESYYRDEKFASVRAAYVSHIQRMFELLDEALPAFAAGVSAAVRAQRAFDLETALAAAHWDNVRTRDAQATYNLLNWSDVRHQVSAAATAAIEAESLVNPDAAEHPAADLDVWLTALNVPAGSFDVLVVREPSFLDGLGSLLIDSKLDEWRDWLVWQVVHSAAPFLPVAFVDEN
jgi:putative endopeptidase